MGDHLVLCKCIIWRSIVNIVLIFSFPNYLHSNVPTYKIIKLKYIHRILKQIFNL